MANNEAAFQAELLSDMKHLGCHALKISDRFMLGVPDIYCCFWGVSGWIELKFEIAPVRTTTNIPVALTTGQRKFIRSEQKAGGRAGWALCVKYPKHWDLHASNNPDVLFAGPDTFLQQRRRGETWDVQGLFKVLVGSDP